MCHHYDDAESQFMYAERASQAAVVAQDQFLLLTALVQMLAAETRRGRAEECSAIEERLSALQIDPGREHLILAYHALRLSWQGRFREAHTKLMPYWKSMNHDFDKFTAGAQCALFLALDGQRSSSIGLIGEVMPLAMKIASQQTLAVRYQSVGRLFCMLAEAVNGRPSHAVRINKQLQRVSFDPVVGAIGSIAREFATLISEGFEPSSLGQLYDTLNQLGYASASKLLYAVQLELRSRRRIDSREKLTMAEKEVLRQLADGLTPKDISRRTGRSVNTVRNHVASIRAKLKCSGQTQAIAVARRSGIIT
jgi:DNA-binding CsgD family transcriptional regulator